MSNGISTSVIDRIIETGKYLSTEELLDIKQQLSKYHEFFGSYPPFVDDSDLFEFLKSRVLDTNDLTKSKPVGGLIVLQIPAFPQTEEDLQNMKALDMKFVPFMEEWEDKLFTDDIWFKCKYIAPVEALSGNIINTTFDSVRATYKKLYSSEGKFESEILTKMFGSSSIWKLSDTLIKAVRDKIKDVMTQHVLSKENNKLDEKQLIDKLQKLKLVLITGYTTEPLSDNMDWTQLTKWRNEKKLIFQGENKPLLLYAKSKASNNNKKSTDFWYKIVKFASADKKSTLPQWSEKYNHAYQQKERSLSARDKEYLAIGWKYLFSRNKGISVTFITLGSKKNNTTLYWSVIPYNPAIIKQYKPLFIDNVDITKADINNFQQILQQDDFVDNIDITEIDTSNFQRVVQPDYFVDLYIFQKGDGDSTKIINFLPYVKLSTMYKTLVVIKRLDWYLESTRNSISRETTEKPLLAVFKEFIKNLTIIKKGQDNELYQASFASMVAIINSILQEPDNQLHERDYNQLRNYIHNLYPIYATLIQSTIYDTQSDEEIWPCIKALLIAENIINNTDLFQQLKQIKEGKEMMGIKKMYEKNWGEILEKLKVDKEIAQQEKKHIVTVIGRQFEQLMDMWLISRGVPEHVLPAVKIGIVGKYMEYAGVKDFPWNLTDPQQLISFLSKLPNWDKRGAGYLVGPKWELLEYVLMNSVNDILSPKASISLNMLRLYISFGYYLYDNLKQDIFDVLFSSNKKTSNDEKQENEQDV